MWFLSIIITISALGACQAQPSAPPASSRPSLVILNWSDYIPAAVIEAFSDEFDVELTIVPYDSTDAATALLESEQRFDVAILDQEYIAPLIADGRLAKINYRLLPNAHNLGAEFRNLVHDPDNVYSIPHTWGTSGLIVRNDLVSRPVTSWQDLWDPSLADKILLRAEPSDVLGISLLTLDLPLWTDDSANMEQAVQKVLQLKGRAIFGSDSDMDVADALVRGDVAIMSGWSSDALYARDQGAAVDYIFPQEGSLFWLNRMVIFADSPQQELAHTFINFVLRPEISAAFVDTYYHATANEAARAFVDPKIATDEWIFPSRQNLARAIWYPPFAAETSRLYEETWSQVFPLLTEP